MLRPRILELGERGGVPLRTFTSALGHGDVVRVPPSEAYLETMATGLGEVFGWNSERAQAYLRGL